MNVLILQPPVMQLNTAYPSGAYLSAFFRSLGCNVLWRDLNIELFDAIFCRAGLERLFSLCADDALALAEKAEQSGDDATAFNLRRYVSQRDLWCAWIERITAMLRGDERESAHRFAFGAHVPRGNRMEQYLANLNHDLTTDDARALASYALADLADFITVVFDKNFALVRYAESLTVSESSFSQIAAGADSPILREFYEPVLERLFQTEAVMRLTNDSFTNERKFLVCVSVPFAGTFAAALCTGRFCKKHFGDKAFVSFGGGFINTELRDCDERALVSYCDALSYDRGYAGYRELVKRFNSDNHLNFSSTESIYKLRLFLTNGSYSQNSIPADLSAVQIVPPLEKDPEAEAYEKEVTSTLIPDFSDIDFSRYPRLIDDTNPMHRLWSDGAWIKVYMAHGCYWHQCAFCDVTLDYVKGYCQTNVHKLYEGILSQCEQKKIYGIHFVDEAMPPALMIQFARENLAHGSPLTWWGNIRFEKQFTRDVADLLAAGGLIGVSGGLEIATGSGLDEIHKGTDLTSIVAACCAFKEAGILVHAYMIYGYWKETPQDLINSMETLRQFYANGLLDSSFWHKFVLTRHSRVYKEWQEGKFPDLQPIDTTEKIPALKRGNDKRENARTVPLFAKNGLHFAGEEKSEKYGAGLEIALNEWMHGNHLNRPVQKWYNFPVPAPTVAKDFIAQEIAKYESKRDATFAAPVPTTADGSPDTNKVFWLGGEKFPAGKNKIGWFYMGEYYEAKKNAPDTVFRGKGLCVLP
ncbi:MAG: radical SAM protein [Treponema sp.]|nr:radical SAM protein [Treponema sp.]